MKTNITITFFWGDDITEKDIKQMEEILEHEAHNLSSRLRLYNRIYSVSRQEIEIETQKEKHEN